MSLEEEKQQIATQLGHFSVECLPTKVHQHHNFILLSIYNCTRSRFCCGQIKYIHSYIWDPWSINAVYLQTDWQTDRYYTMTIDSNRTVKNYYSPIYSFYVWRIMYFIVLYIAILLCNNIWILWYCIFVYLKYKILVELRVGCFLLEFWL